VILVLRDDQVDAGHGVPVGAIADGGQGSEAADRRDIAIEVQGQGANAGDPAAGGAGQGDVDIALDQLGAAAEVTAEAGS